MIVAQYFNKYNNAYINALKRPTVTYAAKILALTHYENVVADITDDCILSESSISIDRTDSVRRRCSLKFRDTDSEYTPSPNSLFWFNRKIKIYKGVIDYNGDIYWWSQGVFVVTDIRDENNEISVEGSDKYAFLNGELKLAMVDGEIQIPDVNNMGVLSKANRDTGNGLVFRNIILDFLTEDLGTGLPLDPIKPLVDPEFENQYLDYQIVVSQDNYPSEVINSLVDGYGFETYYDIEGHLLITKNISFDYYKLASQWNFTDNEYGAIELSSQYNLAESTNAQKVSGTNTDGKVYTYTAYNNNANSPINILLTGLRQANPIEIENGDSTYKCQQKAEYELKKSTMRSLSVSFQYIPIPHLDVGKPIIVNHNNNNLDDIKMIVTSITMPLGVGSMSISAVNIDYLPVEQITAPNLS